MKPWVKHAWSRAGWAVALAAASAPASAHVIAPDYSVFDNGALHALVNLQTLVPLLALGVALGRGSRRVAVLSGLGWLAAFAAGVLLWNRPGNPIAGFGTPLAFLAGGAALMFSGRPGAMISGLSAIIVGGLAGGLGRQEDPSIGVAGWFTLGVGIGGALVVFFAAEAAAGYRPAWLTIPTRIAASWLLAIGLMFLGLALRPPQANVAGTAGSANDASTCPGPHRHGLDGELICLPVPTIDDAKTPSSISRYGGTPPVLENPGTPPSGGQPAP